MDDIVKEQESSPERAAEKQPWQMTKAEYESRYGASRSNTTVTGKFSKHKSAVEIALNKGLEVPPEVLRDYPELSDM